MVAGQALVVRLPYPVRVAAASAHGARLRAWRYGRDTERLTYDALERETWSAEQWSSVTARRLSAVLHRAATQVPYYRDQWDRRRRAGDRSAMDELVNWPVLDKSVVRQTPEALLADDRPRWMYHEHTSGTTGTPLTLWWSRSVSRGWYALFEARVRRWNGVDRSTRWAILGGQLVARRDQTKPPFWVWNAAGRQLYLSSYHLSPPTAAAYCDALRRHRVRYLLGYPSAMHTLAQLALEQGIDAPRLQVCVSNAEPFLEHQRESIAAAFSCPVRDTYGMAELVAAGSECEAGVLHAWPEVGVVETTDHEGRAISVCTGLLNTDMPLVRYAVGDDVEVGPAGERCACGRTLPRIERLEGRSDDLVITPDGRRIGRLDPVFKAGANIVEAQIVQETVDRFRVRLVPASGYSSRDGDAIRARLVERVGEAQVVVEEVDAIERTANGKFRAVISLVDQSGTE